MKPICTRFFPFHYGWVIIATGALATVTVFFAAGQTIGPAGAGLLGGHGADSPRPTCSARF